MKRISLFLSLVLCLLVLCACGKINSEIKYDVNNITAEEAKQLIDTGEYVVLDVRTNEEYDEKHIPNSVHVPIDKNDVAPFKLEVQKQLTDKKAKIIVYCMSGFRSDIASKAMSTLGYEQLYNMTDGIDGWKYEVEPSSSTEVS